MTGPPRQARLPLRGALVAALVLGPLLVTTSALASYGLRAAVGLTAAVLLWRGLGPCRVVPQRARRLLAAAIAVGASSGVVAALLTLLTTYPVVPGGPVDWIYLSYAPLAVGALAVLPRTGAPSSRWHVVVVDGVVACAALVLVVGGRLAAEDVGAGLPLHARVAVVAYPLLPVFVLAALLSVLPWVSRPYRPYLLVSGAGLLVLGVSDLGYAVATVNGWYTATSWPAALGTAGLVLLLAACLVPAGREDTGDAPRRPADELLRAAAPYAPLALVLGHLSVALWQGWVLGRAELVALVVLLSAVVLRHGISALEHGDVLEELAARERTARADASRDALTGLANRGAFLAGLRRTVQDPHAFPVAVALLDLDDFKDINDTHGHSAGDAVLIGVAHRLSEGLPPGATVARLGGDEFALCVPAVRDPEAALGLVLSAFDVPILSGTRRFSVRPSIGVVVAEWRAEPDEVEQVVEELLSHADVAMYRAKNSKGGVAAGVVLLSGLSRAEAAAEVRMRDEIGAPRLEEFGVVYQPVVDLTTGAMNGVEALLRWRHPLHGEVQPQQFIGLAEQVGTISLLAEHALDTALRDLAGWRSRSSAAGDLRMGVNVSPRQLSPSLPGRVLDALHLHGVPADRLVLEITEEALVEDWAGAVGVVEELRASGVRVSVDDFGTGYSSLRYLRRLSPDSLKLDLEFVQAVETEPRSAALVRSVLHMARALDLTSVAEGIETVGQLAAVRDFGFTYGQGFIFSRPVPAAAVEELLRTGHRWPVGPPAVPRLPRQRPTPVAPLVD